MRKGGGTTKPFMIGAQVFTVLTFYCPERRYHWQSREENQKSSREKTRSLHTVALGGTGSQLFGPKVLFGCRRFARFVTALPRPAGLAAWLQGLRPSCLPPISWSASFQPSSRARSWFHFPGRRCDVDASSGPTPKVRAIWPQTSRSGAP